MYVFRPEPLLPGTARPAGAILLSGPYSFDFASPSKGELVYFGEGPKRWPEMVIPGHVTRADIPVLFTTDEWDNARYLWPQAAVYRELVEKHKGDRVTSKAPDTIIHRSCCRSARPTRACRASWWTSSSERGSAEGTPHASLEGLLLRRWAGVVMTPYAACATRKTRLAVGTRSSGIGRPAKSRRQGIAISLRPSRGAIDRALSVAIPVFAYIWR